MSTTYDPNAKKKFFIDQHDIEEWLREQYDVPQFNVPKDLQENASPDGSYSLTVDGEISDYHRDDLDEFFDQVEEQLDGDILYVDPETRYLTKPLMNKLAADGHIPKGDYVIQFSF